MDKRMIILSQQSFTDLNVKIEEKQNTCLLKRIKWAWEMGVVLSVWNRDKKRKIIK